MVASFPEFDYRKHRSQSNSCVPSVHQSKPSRLKPILSTSRPAATTQGAADSSSVLGKILISFHGSFSSSSGHQAGGSPPHDPLSGRRPVAQNASLGDPASEFSGKKIIAAHMGDEPNDVADTQNIRKESILDHSREGSVGKSSELACKTRRKWSSFKAARLHSNGQDSKLGTQNGYTFFSRRGRCKPPGPSECQAAKEGDSTRNAPPSSADSHVGALSARIGDESRALKCDLKEVASPATNVEKKYIDHNSYLDAQVGDEGAHKCTQNRGDVSNVASSVTVPDADGNNANFGSSSNDGREQATCENSSKVSSSATGVQNFAGDNPLYASDNSSNNMRWSSTSCASTDTSSSNSTRRSSCESRTSIMPSSLSFTSHAKPHKVHDATWAAIHNLQLHNGGAPLSIGHFRLVRRVGHGDIGSVFLAHLKEKAVASPADISCLFAIKVMDKDALSQRNKLHRMHIEKEILESVDHPFLPTLYAHFDSEVYSCLVMDYCPGGDLYALRQKQPGKRFGIIAARFYAAEVLLALEYLHMLGIVYRDLKPENVLVREDGHIMLTDFDLSLKCDVKPQLLRHPLLSSSSLLMSASLSSTLSKRRLMRSHSQSSTISSSSTMSAFSPHDSTNGKLPVACSMDPIVSCLSLANNNSRKAQHIQKHQASATALSNMVGYDASKASCTAGPLTSSFRDGSVVEPLQVSKQEVRCAESVAPPEKSNDVEHAKITRMSTMRAAYDTNNTEVTARASTTALGCQEDHMVFMELVAEPTQARSMSFVGTHEYLAPEIIAGHGHGSQVDWWTLGIFVYELLFGKSPFKGASNDQTLINIIRQPLRFPEMSNGDEFEDARSLIEGLLVKDPRRRLGCTKGAAEIKQHAFFQGVNWALIRCTQPPEMPCKHLSRRQVNNPSSYHQIHRQIYRTDVKSHHHFDIF